MFVEWLGDLVVYFIVLVVFGFKFLFDFELCEGYVVLSWYIDVIFVFVYL